MANSTKPKEGLSSLAITRVGSRHKKSRPRPTLAKSVFLTIRKCITPTPTPIAADLKDQDSDGEDSSSSSSSRSSNSSSDSDDEDAQDLRDDQDDDEEDEAESQVRKSILVEVLLALGATS